MNRLLAFVTVLLAIPPAGLNAADSRRPNFLFILVDDQSPFDLKVYNPDSPLETPHIDRLAREGMVFDGAYHMGAFVGAVCTPSRHMIMSGRTPGGRRPPLSGAGRERSRSDERSYSRSSVLVAVSIRRE